MRYEPMPMLKAQNTSLMNMASWSFGTLPPDISNIYNISDIRVHMFCCLTYHFGDISGVISNIFHSHMF